MDLSRRLISRGPNRYVDESLQDQEEPLLAVEMVGCTSVPEHSYAMTTSIEESNASKQQEQSSTPMNCTSKEFIPTDRRKWIDILAVDNVKRESVPQKISKKLTTFVRHRQRNREVDGAVSWYSLLTHATT